jgi:hypothetical protein
MWSAKSAIRCADADACSCCLAVKTAIASMSQAFCDLSYPSPDVDVGRSDHCVMIVLHGAHVH